MHRATVLTIGLLCLVALIVYTAMVSAPVIEADIQARTAQTVTEAGNDFVDVRADGRDIIATGAAPSDGEREDVVATAASVAGVRLVRDEMTVLDPPISPFTFSATKADGGVSLEGFVPDEATKTALVEQADSLFDGPISDETIIARGVPDESWGDAVAAGLAQLPALEEGGLSVQDTTLTLTGSVASDDDASALESGLLAGLPAGYTFDPGFEVVAPPPVVETASNETQQETEPEQTDEESDTGAAENTPETDPADSDAAEEAEPTDDAAVEDQQPVSAPLETLDACQEAIDETLTGRSIQFSTASAVISPDSYELLNDLGSVASRCPDAAIAVEGHTDSTGQLQSNIDLSLARAEAVVEYLVGLGIGRSRLSAFGFGPTLPIASNDTAEGRSQNRRIEFKVER